MLRRSFCLGLVLTACATAGRDDRDSTTVEGGSVSGPHTKTRTEGGTTPSIDGTRHREYAAANNAFGFDMWKQIAEPGNLSIAPASVSLALGMTMAGARGDTAAQMAKVLHVEDIAGMTASMGKQLRQWNVATDNYEMSVVDRLFGEQTATFEPEFLALVKERFAAPLEPVDFITGYEGARGRINDWVEDETKDRIVDLLPTGSLTTDTRLVLTNAVYFKGDWQHPFLPSETQSRTFWVDGREQKSAKLMAQTSSFGYATTDDAQVIELPYKGGDLAMTIVLPKARDGLAALEAKLDGEGFAALVAGLSPTMVELSLPKFKLEMNSSLALGDVLKKLGMPLAFGSGADFTGISKTISPLFIDQVFHKTFVAVDEEGTEAAAATAVVMTTESYTEVPKGVPFVADHPFLFVLRDVRSGAVLFIGRVVDPK